MTNLTRVVATQTFASETGTYPTTVVPLEQELRTKYAGDIRKLSLISHNTNILALEDKKISNNGIWAGPE